MELNSDLSYGNALEFNQFRNSLSDSGHEFYRAIIGTLLVGEDKVSQQSHQGTPPPSSLTPEARDGVHVCAYTCVYIHVCEVWSKNETLH